MGKICEKCGNMIPDGLDACPVCGRETEGMAEVLGAAETDHTTDSRHEQGKSEQPNPDAPKVRKAPERKPQAQKPTGKKRKKKNNSAALVGVIIGLIIVLLIVACFIAYGLYQMGVFTTMSDEELLGPANVQTTLEPTATPEPTPPAEEPEEIPEEPVEASALEEPEPEEPAEPEPEQEEELEVEEFTVTGGTTLTLNFRGETTTIAYVIQPSKCRDLIEWTSSDETVAVVDSFGTIRGRRGGTCTIVGTCGSKSISATVTCNFEVPSTILDMNMEDITMSYEGQTAELAIDYELTEEQIKATVWESSDPEVAKVDRNGVVTAVANGTAVITASINEYTASCIVRCVNVTGNRGVNPEDSEFVINYEDVTLTRRGEYFQLTLTSILGNSVPEFTWKSDDTAVATVSSDGVVTAVSNGTAYITATIGQDEFQCIVRVRIS